MSLDYEYSKTGMAVSALAASAEPIQKRLYYAWDAMHTLIGHGIKDPERQAAYTSICDRLSSHPADGDEGTVMATTSRLSDEEAEGLAREIADLHTGLMHDRIYALEDELRDLKR